MAKSIKMLDKISGRKGNLLSSLSAASFQTLHIISFKYKKSKKSHFEMMFDLRSGSNERGYFLIDE